MQFWLYSSGDGWSNAAADRELIKSIGSRARLTFVPSPGGDASEYVAEFVERFRAYGRPSFKVFPVDRPYSGRELLKALAADLVYLSGGNTFAFLHALRASGFAVQMQRYTERGGVLAGHSAGAILMTPTIRTAGFPADDRDDNEVGLKDLRALRLVEFEVFPHYVSRIGVNDALKRASRATGRPIYALADGSAIARAGEQLVFHGPVWAFVKGVRFRVNW